MGTDYFTILQLVLINETGDSYYRMRWPGAELAKQAPDWRVINLDARAEERFKWALDCDLLVLYQSNDLELLPVLERRRQAGKATLVEYNDNFYEPPLWSPVGQAWTSPLIWQAYERFMEQADHIIVTGTGLSELFGAQFKASKIAILPNHMPNENEPFEALWGTRQTQISRELHLGWAGSLGHVADFLAVLPSIKQLMQALPQLKLYLMGNEAFPSLVGLPSERFVFKAWGSMSEYYAFLKELHIGIAPLLDTPYNRCRSDIKALELAAYGALPLVAKAAPYAEFIAQTGAPNFSSFSELAELVRHFASNPQELKSQAQTCHRYVGEQRLASKHFERLELYKRFMPASPTSAVSWPVPCGYHELQGTAQSKGALQILLEETQKLATNKQFSEALGLIQRAREQNPFHPELCMAELKLLFASNDMALEDKITAAIKTFPKDLRFQLLAAYRLRDISGISSFWEKFFNTLTASSKYYRLFFLREGMTLFLRHLQQVPKLLTQAQQVLEWFPDWAEVRLIVASIYERAGHTKEAQAQFAWLSSSCQAFALNQKFLAGLQPGYCEALLEALTARLRGY